MNKNNNNKNMIKLMIVKKWMLKYNQLNQITVVIFISIDFFQFCCSNKLNSIFMLIHERVLIIKRINSDTYKWLLK